MPPRQALEDQTRQSIKVAEGEIEELKQSLRYIEIQLARSKEENENLHNKVLEQQGELEVSRCYVWSFCLESIRNAG